MSTPVVMPKAGLTMVEGTIVEWKVPEGAAVNKGDVLMEYENEKNTIEFESLGSGILHITAQEGETVPIGEPIGVLADAHREALEKGITNSIASCTLMVELGRTIYFSHGSEKNIKLTTPEDFDIFRALLTLRDGQ